MQVLEQPAASRERTGAVGSEPRSAEELIIREARRRRRRRYVLSATAFVAILGAIAVGVVISDGGGRPPPRGHHHAGTAPPRATPPVSAPKPPGVALPSSALFNQISVTSDGLLLTGVTNATGESPTSSPQATCVAAPLDPLSLGVGQLDVGGCGDPLLTGRSVEVIETPIPQSNNATISINVADPATGQVTEGPVVMTYGSYSDTRPVIAYGTQWLWIYDVETTNGPELLQVSTSSGEVVNTVRMPTLYYKPLLAADDGGVWIANSFEGSSAPALYYVDAWSSAPSVVISDSNVPVCWLQADGTSAWVGVGVQSCGKQAVERFVDHSTAPLFSVPGNFLAFTVIGNETDGLWTMQLNAGVQQIVSIDPRTGAERIVATLPYGQEPILNQEDGLVPDQAVYYEGALYVLLPPFRSNGYLGYSSVVRVPVPAG